MMSECHVPPTGWRCTRGDGHIGPCAAIPIQQKDDSMKEGWTRLKVVVGNLEGGPIRRQHVKVLDENGNMVGGIQAVDVRLHVDGRDELTITTIDFDAVVEGEYKIDRPRRPLRQRLTGWLKWLWGRVSAS